ncbi:hypothetical protein Tco_0747406 [Tanacetum coccineum]|uniref:Uncharacterized protein n=1 Tax=Tanacetum coccineum TaxID=301880 RepID=A0ABQ4YSZ7_9ASTR
MVVGRISVCSPVLLHVLLKIYSLDQILQDSFRFLILDRLRARLVSGRISNLNLASVSSDQFFFTSDLSCSNLPLLAEGAIEWSVLWESCGDRCSFRFDWWSGPEPVKLGVFGDENINDWERSLEVGDVISLDDWISSCMFHDLWDGLLARYSSSMCLQGFGPARDTCTFPESDPVWSSCMGLGSGPARASCAFPGSDPVWSSVRRKGYPPTPDVL